MLLLMQPVAKASEYDQEMPQSQTNKGSRVAQG